MPDVAFPGARLPLVRRTLGTVIEFAYKRGVVDGVQAGLTLGGIVGFACGAIAAVVIYTVFLHVFHWLTKRTRPPCPAHHAPASA
jgi:uncharacterized protein YqgC (DUF456 family)